MCRRRAVIRAICDNCAETGRANLPVHTSTCMPSVREIMWCAFSGVFVLTWIKIDIEPKCCFQMKGMDLAWEKIICPCGWLQCIVPTFMWDWPEGGTKYWRDKVLEGKPLYVLLRMLWWVQQRWWNPALTDDPGFPLTFFSLCFKSYRFKSALFFFAQLGQTLWTLLARVLIYYRKHVSWRHHWDFGNPKVRQRWKDLCKHVIEHPSVQCSVAHSALGCWRSRSFGILQAEFNSCTSTVINTLLRGMSRFQNNWHNDAERPNCF